MANNLPPVADEVVLECAGLHKTFGAFTAVRDVTLSLRRGQILGLVGPTGAGKTTLLRMLSTLYPGRRADFRTRCGRRPSHGTAADRLFA